MLCHLRLSVYRNNTVVWKCQCNQLSTDIIIPRLQASKETNKKKKMGLSRECKL